MDRRADLLPGGPSPATITARQRISLALGQGTAANWRCARGLSVPMLSRPIHEGIPGGLKNALRQLAGGVSIITAGDAEHRSGFTASSLTSLTLEPPCILVCINRRVSAWPMIRSERRFCANLLAARHQPLAMRFSSGGVRGSVRFEAGDWITGDHGLPVLADALAAIECDLEDAIERHSHIIAIGAVRHLRVAAPGTPLIYAHGEYGRMEPV